MSEARRSHTQPNQGTAEALPTGVLRAVELAMDRKASDVVVIDLAKIPESAAVTDYFIICTGRSDVQVQAICEHVAHGMRDSGMTLLSSEGVSRGQWALLDYGDIVVHVFQAGVRKHYDLERLWAHGPRWTFRVGSDIEQSLA